MDIEEAVLESMRHKANMVVVAEYFENAENPSWDDFREKNPDFDKWEYESGIKAIQEM